MKPILQKLLSMGVLLGLLCSPAYSITITSTNNASTLANAISGTGITISSATFTGNTLQAGTFQNGNASGIGFDEGIVLMTGDVGQINGSNNTFSETLNSATVGDADDISTDLGGTGDSQLTALAGSNTYDAAILEFDFEFDSGTGGDLYFNFVFASEEYLNYVNTGYNDVFGFWVDGVNIALVPGTSDAITINTINPNTNSSYYRNNVNNTNGIANLGLYNHFDGLTTKITAEMIGLGSGSHTMKFGVADTLDHVLDAGVFIEAGTFSSEKPTVPEPTTMLLFGLGLLGLAGVNRKR